ncbi:MAG TPA: hypothetical protein VM802_03710, partial [Chitinophaga sp.]|uniref:tetratricopeptide repeat protein n=1 Tax=Chitinophaga sp. TaxID=1869181 RepID=UPI002C602480
LLAYACYTAGKLQDASNYYEQVLKLDSNYIPAHQYLASIQMQQDLLQPLAVTHYQHIVSLKPQSAAAWKQLSFAALTARQEDSGFVWLRKAYDLNPADPKVAARLAEEWLDRKNYPTADSIINVFLATDSSQASVLMTGVRTAYYQKAYTRSVILGDKLMSMQVISPNTFSFVIAACYNLKKYQQCVDIYNYLLDRNAASPNIMYYAALANTQLKKYQESNELLQQCITLAKTVAMDDYYTGMASNYELLGQNKSAIACLDTAYYLFRKPLRQYSIGRIYDTKLQNGVTAIRYYKRYMQQYDSSSAEEKSIYHYLKARVAAN